LHIVTKKNKIISQTTDLKDYYYYSIVKQVNIDTFETLLLQLFFRNFYVIISSTINLLF